MILLKLMRLKFLFKLTADTTLKYKEEKDGGRNVYKDRIAVVAVLIRMGLRSGRTSDVFKMQKVYQQATVQIKHG